MKKSPAAPVVNCEGDFSLSSLKQSLQPHQAALLGHIQPQGAPSFQGSNGLNLRLTNSAVEAGLIWMVFNFVCGRFSRSAEQQNMSAADTTGIFVFINPLIPFLMGFINKGDAILSIKNVLAPTCLYWCHWTRGWNSKGSDFKSGATQGNRWITCLPYSQKDCWFDL